MKKLVSVFMAVLMLISIFPLSVIAEELNNDVIYHSAGLEGGKFFYDLSNGRSAAVKSYNGTFPLSGLFYDQLNAQQKEVYNAFLATGITTENFNVTLSSPITFNPNNDPEWDTVSNVVFAAFFAVLRDYPERFWYDYVSWNGSASVSGSNYRVSQVTVYIGFHESYDASTITGVYNQLMDAVNAFHPVGATRYEKVRSIHDYLVNLATYDPDYDNEYANPYGHQPTGCLLSPYLCVCEGYAEAFKIFADREGIPNMLVTSATHIWNVILMEDNKWYALDCTWDDPMTGNVNNNCLYYDYFLIGSQTVPYGETEPFSQQEDHVEEYCFTDTNGISLINPPLNTTSYAPFYPLYSQSSNGPTQNDNPGGSILQTKNLVFIIPGRTVSNSFDMDSFYGTFSYNNSNKTGSQLTFTPPSGVNSITYTVIMRGDVNKDGNVNNTDFSYVSDISVGTRTYSSTSPETYAGDCNGDGVVDGFDLALLDRYQSGNYSFY